MTRANPPRIKRVNTTNLIASFNQRPFKSPAALQQRATASGHTSRESEQLKRGRQNEGEYEDEEETSNGPYYGRRTAASAKRARQDQIQQPPGSLSQQQLQQPSVDQEADYQQRRTSSEPELQRQGTPVNLQQQPYRLDPRLRPERAQDTQQHEQHDESHEYDEIDEQLGIGPAKNRNTGIEEAHPSSALSKAQWDSPPENLTRFEWQKMTRDVELVCRVWALRYGYYDDHEIDAIIHQCCPGVAASVANELLFKARTNRDSWKSVTLKAIRVGYI